MSIYLKDPQASVDYTIDWPAAFIGAGSIASSEWAVAPDEAGGIAVAASSLDGGHCVATLEGGLAGHVYRVRNRILLSDGRSDERSLTLRVEER